MGVQRLDRILVETGQWSRKEARELIRKGQVLVNGAAVRQTDCKIDPEQSALIVQGEPIRWQKFCYLLLNKPAGVLTATEDRGQKTVLDLLPERYRRQGVAPVGRLDKDTTGLLLLTNDGELTHQLLSPRSHVPKVYLAETEGTVDEADAAAFSQGMTLGDSTVCLPAGLNLLAPGQCLVTLYEGKYHQVKRMLAARGKPVTALKRLSMGTLTLEEGLEEGAWRELTQQELEGLRQAVAERRKQTKTGEKSFSSY